MAWKEKGDRYGSFWSGRETSTQKAPYGKPLPYLALGGTAAQSGGVPEWPIDIRNRVPLANGYGWGPTPSAVNKALSKLYDQLEQSESLRVAWKEREKALALVTSSLRTIVRIARAVKRRDPRIVRAIIGKDPSKKDILKTPADIWLAYNFGIVPTIMDIHHGLGIFGFDPPVMKLQARATVPYNRWGEGDFGTRLQKDSVVLGGEIYQFDPNVSLASRLGFGQPLSVAWEMTPFSWFVDYFVNVGDMLKNLEPRFPGIHIRNQYTSVFCRYAPTDFNFYGSIHTYSGFYFRRTLGWPSFQLEFPILDGLRVKQASYIASVAIQLLSSMKKKA